LLGATFDWLKPKKNKPIIYISQVVGFEVPHFLVANIHMSQKDPKMCCCLEAIHLAG
jgi:hypothetical protein